MKKNQTHKLLKVFFMAINLAISPVKDTSKYDLQEKYIGMLIIKNQRSRMQQATNKNCTEEQ